MAWPGRSARDYATLLRRQALVPASRHDWGVHHGGGGAVSHEITRRAWRALQPPAAFPGPHHIQALTQA